MNMRNRTILLATAALLAFVFASSLLSEASWWARRDSSDSLRQTVGLPSVAVGNLNPMARSPGLELLCPGLYDSPGGYCYYFTAGIYPFNFTVSDNRTLTDGTK
jgi:hypothetical protein